MLITVKNKILRWYKCVGVWPLLLAGCGDRSEDTTPLPDLTLESISVPGLAKVGVPFLVQKTAQNKGDADIQTFRVGVYLSEDQKVTTSDLLVGSLTISGLLSGEEERTPIKATIPPNTGPGIYYAGALVDDLNEHRESKESNNSLVASNSIEVISIELTALDVATYTQPGRTKTILLEANMIGVQFDLLDPPAHGSLDSELPWANEHESTCSLIYTPGDSFHGQDTFRYQVTKGSQAAQASVRIDVNDRPIVYSQVFNPSGRFFSDRLNAEDKDGDVLTFCCDPPAHGRLSLDPANGDFTYSSNDGFLGIDHFGCWAQDGYLNGESLHKNIWIGVEAQVPSTCLLVLIFGQVLISLEDKAGRTISTEPSGEVVINIPDSAHYSSNSEDVYLIAGDGLSVDARWNSYQIEVLGEMHTEFTLEIDAIYGSREIFGWQRTQTIEPNGCTGNIILSSIAGPMTVDVRFECTP